MSKKYTRRENLFFWLGIIGPVLGLAVVAVAVLIFINVIIINPYSGKGLALQAPPDGFSDTSIKWSELLDAKTSPDQLKSVTVASHGVYCKSVHTTLVTKDRVEQPLVTLEEADPCSGRSWRWYWSEDSRYLKLDGLHLDKGSSQSFRYIYDVEANEFYEVDVKDRG